MSSVFKRQFKTFMVHFNRAVRDRCGICKYRSFKPYDPLPYAKNKFVSRLYEYYWEPNHQWNGGHLSQLYFRLVYEPSRNRFIVLYYFNDEHLGTQSWFNREVEFNYVKWCVKQDYRELLQIVFPFHKKSKLPDRMETPFDSACDRFAKELANSENASNDFKSHIDLGGWRFQQRKAIVPLVKMVRARKGDKPTADEFDARAEFLKTFDTRLYLVAHPQSKQIYVDMALKVFKARERCTYRANLMLDRW